MTKEGSPGRFKSAGSAFIKKKDKYCEKTRDSDDSESRVLYPENSSSGEGKML